MKETKTVFYICDETYDIPDSASRVDFSHFTSWLKVIGLKEGPISELVSKFIEDCISGVFKQEEK